MMAEPDETHYQRKRLIRELRLVLGAIVVFAAIICVLALLLSWHFRDGLGIYP